jgi:hypothetical protein
MITYKQTSGRRRSVVASCAAALAAAGVASAVGVAPTAGALCVGFSGLDIGNGCHSSFLSFALVLGPDTGTADAGIPGTFSPFNIAISLGDSHTNAGGPFTPATGLMNIGNIAFANPGNTVTAVGILNLAASLGGTGSGLNAVGVGNNAWNIGSHNPDVLATGFFSNATVLFSDNNVMVRAGSDPTKTGLQGILSGFNVAFSIFGNNNQVLSGVYGGGTPVGPLSIAGGLGVTGQTGAKAIMNSNFGIAIRTPFNALAATAAGTKVAPLAAVNAGGSQVSGSLKKAGSQLNASLKKAGSQVKGALNKARK